jgi:bifunctional non-homologous end joining protein LigD
MPAKPRKRNEAHPVAAQPALFDFLFEPSRVPALRWYVEKRASAGQIQEHNRAVASQRLCAIKKHRATRLHYDLRLKFEGVLLSWVIPDGPSYIAGARRMAIEMEDHDPEYISSERVIPEGKPGAGPLMQWDQGTWAPSPECEDVKESLRKGYLGFTLHCEKLKGNWILLRRPDGCWGRREPVWDLIKEPDAFARSADAPSITVEAPDSVISGRTLAEIEGNENKGKRERDVRVLLF